jgi:phosphate uptake regulator
MNARMKELASQATSWVCKNEPMAFDDDDLFDKLQMEKFAELIVRECIKIADETGYILDDHETQPVETKIANYFGVEKG